MQNQNSDTQLRFYIFRMIKITSALCSLQNSKTSNKWIPQFPKHKFSCLLKNTHFSWFSLGLLWLPSALIVVNTYTLKPRAKCSTHREHDCSWSTEFANLFLENVKHVFCSFFCFLVPFFFGPAFVRDSFFPGLLFFRTFFFSLSFSGPTFSFSLSNSC